MIVHYKNKLNINYTMKNYLENMYDNIDESNESITNCFDKYSKLSFNRRLKNKNFYMLDRYNLIIRKEDQNKIKSPYGWIYHNNEPICMHIDDILLRTSDDKYNIQHLTIQKLKNKFPKFFAPSNPSIIKLYDAFSKELADESIILDILNE